MEGTDGRREFVAKETADDEAAERLVQILEGEFINIFYSHFYVIVKLCVTNVLTLRNVLLTMYNISSRAKCTSGYG